MGIRADRGYGEETAETPMIPLLQVQCPSTATRTTLTASETRSCSPEPRISSISLAASEDTEVGTEVTGLVIPIPVSILSLCFRPHPPVPRPLTQSCTSHVSRGVCCRQKLQNDIPLSVQPETLFPDRQCSPILDPTKLNTRPDGS